jgi:hypothetical protein
LAGSELSPPNDELLTQQGGSLVFRGRTVLFWHADSGILKYTDLDALLAALPDTKLLPGTAAGAELRSI